MIPQGERPDRENRTPARKPSLRVRVARTMALGLAVFVAGAGVLLAYGWFRPNGAVINPDLKHEDWAAVADGMHNSNTDLIFWRGQFWLIHARSPWHFGSTRCKLVLRRSADARTWEEVRDFKFEGQDIRDPKFAVIHDRLFLYVLKNTAFNPEPLGTAVTSTADGETWSAIEAVQPEGWLFWRPKTRDGDTWYVPAYWFEHGKSILLKSRDGVNWTQVSVIHEGDRNDETDIEFLPGGRLIATARLEISERYAGDKNACTLIAVAAPPYTEWTTTKSYVTRLDGPCLFAYDGAVYAVGRHNPDARWWLDYFGSIYGRKRTALYAVEPDRLIYVSDLPSAGDTSYAGIVRRGEDLYVSYYTSRIDRDYPWILGMMASSDIRVAKVSLPSLAAAASRLTL